jgi:hypothetical protein
MVFFIKVRKTSQRKLNSELIDNQLSEFFKRILKEGRRKKGWRMARDEPTVSDVTISVTKKTEDGTEVTEEKQGLAYDTTLYATCNSKGKRLKNIVVKEFEDLVKIFTRTSKSKSWEVTESGEMPEDFAFPGEDVEEASEEVSEEVSEGTSEGVQEESEHVVDSPQSEELAAV